MSGRGIWQRLLAVLTVALICPWAKAYGAPIERAYVLAVPDRGFTGNEEARAIAAALAKTHPAELLIVTDQRTTGMLTPIVRRLAEQGAETVSVLPLFVAAAGERYGHLRDAVEAQRDGPARVEIGRPFGESYLAVEILADRLRGVDDPGGRELVVAGYGASDPASCEAMEQALARIAGHAAAGFGFASVRAVVWPAWGDDVDAGPCGTASEAVLEDAGENRVIAPFHLGPKLDSMMGFTPSLRREAGDAAEVLEAITPHPAVLTWARREANRLAPVRQGQVGVLFHAHGSDYHWNEGMRRAAAGLGEDYLLEVAFSMADQQTIAPAVQRLEDRGATTIVLVRVFGRKDSFRRGIRRMIGQDVEAPAPIDDHQAHGHGHHAGDTPGPRIRSSAHVVTVGGLGADPLFARALLDRARELSIDPARETIILVAHGMGDDAADAAWMETLGELARHMRAHGGEAFRAIRGATWREDWPEKRGPAIERVRAMVREANAEGGRAIVIPARTTARGHAREFLQGLEFALGEGFAPHPLFQRWLREQVALGLAVYRDTLHGRLSGPLRDVADRATTERLATGDRCR